MKHIIILLLMFVALATIGAGCVKTKTTEITNVSVDSAFNSVFSFAETDFDFGIIKQSGGKVTHDFVFTYMGKDPIIISGVPTSCACTSATVNKTQFNLGDTGILTVKFNPNLHDEPEGKFFKTISLLTEPKIDEEVEVKIWAEIDLDLGPEAYELQQSTHEEEDEEDEEDAMTAYHSITPEIFAGMLEDKDFTLIDVHIPEQEHIVGTDSIIPYDEIEGDARLPKDKHAKIVLYCRSGGMSRAAAYALVEDGYTNVYDLSGGKNAYDAFLNQ